MFLTERFTEALGYAAQLHAQQVRKGSGIPYVSHLLAVAAIALEHGADEDTAIAALLHDAIEDQGGAVTGEEIRRRFGERVAATVAACSDTDEIPKPPWRQRKLAYIAHMAEATPEARLVSASDKLHNARSLLLDYRVHGDAMWQRFGGGRDGSLWYYRSLVTALRDAGFAPAPLLEELDRTVTELERLAELA